MKRILAAPNSFKECACSTEAARLISKSFEDLIPGNAGQFEIVQFPISDGGDGFLEVIKKHFNTSTRHYSVKSLFDDSSNICPVEYSSEKKTVYVESAKVVGLNLVPAKYRNPLKLNTAPMGELLLKINDEVNPGLFPVDNVIIGIGGTATNDLGAGLLSMFSLHLFDSAGSELIPVPEYFDNVCRIESPSIKLKFSIQIVIDVENPLLGEKGASKVFAHQKGANEADIMLMESGFENLLRFFMINSDSMPSLSGSGGGLAAAFQLFFNAEIINAKQFILDYLGLSSKYSNFQIVITGEGILDDQTLLSKGAMVIIDFFRNKNCSIFFICGENKLYKELEFLNVIELKHYFESSKDSIKKFPEGIMNACRTILNKYSG